MTDFAARIRRVRLHGGADVHVLQTPMPDDINGDPENWRGKLISHAKNISGQGEPGGELDGYLIVGLFEDGSSSLAFRLPARIPQCLVPAYITELIRRDAVVSREAERVFDYKFEWVEK